MRNGGRYGIEEAPGEKSFPRGMLKGQNIHAVAEFSEDRFRIRGFAILGERQQVYTVISGETFEEMKGAMIGAAIQWPGNVGINGENFHQL